MVLPPQTQSAFEWTKCKVLDDLTTLQEWYANDKSQYGNLRDPQQGDDEKVEVSVPRMIALPLRAAQMYQKFKGAVMPHELLAEIERHLASTETTLGNVDDWGLVKKWLMVAAQTDGGQGATKPRSHIAFNTTAIITNDELIQRWMTDRLSRECLLLKCLPKPSFEDMSCVAATCRRHVFGHVADTRKCRVG